MKIQHASAPHLGREDKITPAKTIPVYEVGKSNEEDEFLAQMENAKESFSEQPTAGIPLLIEDPIIQQEEKSYS
jgi:hypothetical protein